MGRIRVVVILCLIVLVSGCGLRGSADSLADVESAYNHARDSISYAKSLGADDHSPELLRLAQNRLDKLRENQKAAPYQDLIREYRGVQTIAERAATRSLQKNLNNLKRQVRRQATKQENTAELQSSVDDIRQRIDTLADRLEDSAENASRLDSLNDKVQNLRDEVARIDRLDSEMGNLREELKDATSVQRVEELRNLISRNRALIENLCRSVNEIYSTIINQTSTLDTSRGSSDKTVCSLALETGGDGSEIDQTPPETKIPSDSAHKEDDRQSQAKSGGKDSKTKVEHQPLEGLMSYWALNEKEGPIVEDHAGNATGERIGSIPGQTGIKGSAHAFPGKDQRIRIPDQSVLNFDRELSVSVWVRTETRGTQYILAKGLNSDGPKGSPYSLHLSENGDIVFSLNTSEGSTQVRSVGYDLDRWYHIVGVYDRGEVILYINGERVTTFSHDGSLDDNNLPLFIGSDYSGEHGFQGRIDEVKLFGRALKSEEIKQNYRNLWSR